MSKNRSVSDPEAVLARCCQEEMQKFRSGQPSDDRPCLELFRHAITEGSEQAWNHVVREYRIQVRKWVGRDLSFPASSDEIEQLVQDAFYRFWSHYDQEALHQARRLGQVLTYLKLCVRSAVIQLGRERQRRALEAPLDDTYPSVNPNPAASLDAYVLWAIVAEHCQDETDSLLARQVLAGNLKPRHIYDYYPHLFTDIQDVYRRKRNLLERLQRDTRLKDEFGS